MGWEQKKTLDGMVYYANNETEELSWRKPEALMSQEEIEANKGEWVWVPHPVDIWQPGLIQKRNEDGSVDIRLVDGASMTIPKDGVMRGPETGGRRQVVPLWELKKGNLQFLEDDMVMLDPLNEANIIRNLAQRYDEGEIYTWVGASRSVLVSVNPYRELDVYGDDHIELHRAKGMNRHVPPHVFAIANDSYDSMGFEGVNQSILISGESGAGKTVATKQCLKFLANVAGSESNVEQKVLVANPLLEAFGNAKTIRNINSSRFGKWMEVYFSPQTQKMVGSQLINYLLEKSRVVHQQANERNYHIFYQMCADSTMTSNFNLDKPETFTYLNQSGCITVPQIDDVADFANVNDAMDTLEFLELEKKSIFQLTAAIMFLGNIEFDYKLQAGSTDGSEIKSGTTALSNAAKLLEISEATLAKILCYRTIRADKADAARIPLSPTEAKIACDSLSMGIYGKLFNWMVGRVNEGLGTKEGMFIGILDIFGFEIFDNNSFEQLCINYANEKLQQLFNRTTFKEEEQLYKTECVPYEPIQFIDNQPVLNLVESRPDGILPTLDDECLLPEGSDQKFMNKIEDRHNGSVYFQTDDKRRFKNLLSFEINHYAGIVKYDASEFMTKNLDTVYQDMYMAMSSSTNQLLSSLFGNNNIRIKTLSHQFRSQLDALMKVLYTTESRFIRCIKPNDTMSPKKFESGQCIEQLRYSGVFEAVEIRRTGYPFRYKHQRFINRYSFLNVGHKYQSDPEDLVTFIKEFISVSKQNLKEIQIGKSMVLFRANEFKILELMRNMALENLVPRIQNMIRGGMARRLKRDLEKAELQVEDAIESNDVSTLEQVIQDGNNVLVREQRNLYSDYRPRNLQVAKQYVDDLSAWLDAEQKMKQLCDTSDPNAIYDKLKEADDMTANMLKDQDAAEENSTTDYYGRKGYRRYNISSAQKDLRAKIQELILQCTLGLVDKELAEAIESLDEKRIVASLERADELKHNTPDCHKARELLAEFEQLDSDVPNALACVSKTMMKEVLKTAERLKRDNDLIREVRKMMALDERDFVEAEYERAKEVNDIPRKIHREIRLMEYKYDHADKGKYSLERLGQVRSREDFANAASFVSKMLGGNKELMMSMMSWTKKQIPTSLTISESERDTERGNSTPEVKAKVKEFKKEAKANFKSVLKYTESKSANVHDAARDILTRGLNAYRNGNDDMLRELYLQVLKQLNGNDTHAPRTSAEDPRKATSTTGTSYQNGLALLAMMISTFPGSTRPYETDEKKPATFDDAVVVWVLSNVHNKDRKKYIHALHNCKYSNKLAQVPDPALLRNQFSVMEGKFEIDPEADSGPSKESLNLYIRRESEAV